MNDKIVSATIDILGKVYPIRCPESEVESLKQAAEFLNQKMREVQESGKAINLERIAIITALNISNQYLKLDEQKGSLMDKINQRIASLQDKLDFATNKKPQAELIYSAE